MTFENAPAILRSWLGGEALDSFSCRSDVVEGQTGRAGWFFVVLFFVVGLELEGRREGGWVLLVVFFVVLVVEVSYARCSCLLLLIF